MRARRSAYGAERDPLADRGDRVRLERVLEERHASADGRRALDLVHEVARVGVARLDALHGRILEARDPDEIREARIRIRQVETGRKRAGRGTRMTRRADRREHVRLDRIQGRLNALRRGRDDEVRDEVAALRAVARREGSGELAVESV